jgi:hypothetical protein
LRFDNGFPSFIGKFAGIGRLHETLNLLAKRFSGF